MSKPTPLWIWLILGGGVLTAVAIARARQYTEDRLSPRPIPAPPEVTPDKHGALPPGPVEIVQSAYDDGKKAGAAVVETVKNVLDSDEERSYSDLPDSVQRGITSAVRAVKSGLPDAVVAAVVQATSLSPRVIRVIAAIESGGNPDATRFEANKYRSYAGKAPPTPGSGWSATEAAYAVDPAAAVRATSWGAFQVLDPVQFGLAASPQAWMATWKGADNTKKWALSVALIKEWFTHPQLGWRAALRDAANAEKAGGGATAWEAFAKKYNGPSALELLPSGQGAYHKRMAMAYDLLA